MKNYILFTLLFICFGAFSQEKYTISGTIADSTKGEELINAKITVKGQGTGTFSNEYGFYSLTLPKGTYTLIYSTSGYEPKEISVELDRNMVMNHRLISLAEKVHQSTYAKPYSAMVEYLDAMDSALFFAAPPATAPRRVLAALGPKMLKLSAQRGLGAHPYFVPVEHTLGAREILGADALLAPEIAVVFDTNAETARATARKHMLTYNRLPNYANNLLRLGYSQNDIAGPDKLPSDKMVDAIVAWGTLETVVERINAHIDAGANHVSVQVLSNKDGELPIAQWRELATALKTFN